MSITELYAEAWLDNAILKAETGVADLIIEDCRCNSCMMGFAAETDAILTYRLMTGRYTIENGDSD